MTAAPSASASRLSVSRHGGGVKHGPQSLRFEEVSISNICLSVRALHNFFLIISKFMQSHFTLTNNKFVIFI